MADILTEEEDSFEPRDRHMQRTPCRNNGGGESDTAMCQGTSRRSIYHQGLEKRLGQVLLHSPRRRVHANICTSDFSLQRCEMIQFCYLRHWMFHVAMTAWAKQHTTQIVTHWTWRSCFCSHHLSFSLSFSSISQTFSIRVSLSCCKERAKKRNKQGCVLIM
jgi:hypothetical protein